MLCFTPHRAHAGRHCVCAACQKSCVWRRVPDLSKPTATAAHAGPAHALCLGPGWSNEASGDPLGLAVSKVSTFVSSTASDTPLASQTAREFRHEACVNVWRFRLPDFGVWGC